MAQKPLKIVAKVALGLSLALLAYLALWPVAFEPEAWEAPQAPALTGDWAVNEALAEVELLELPPGEAGPEDLHELGGFIYTGTDAGHIVRWPRAGGAPEIVADTGGRPLGLHVDGEGRLVIADGEAGLLRLEADGSLTTLCDQTEDGSPVNFADDLDIAADGSVWFSDASTRHSYHDSIATLIENRPDGRLLRWLPGRGTCEVVLSGLYFANGVALAADGSFVLVNETARYRVRRYWISGPRAGEDEGFVDNLPGFPDGVSRGEDGLFWVALASTRNPIMDALDDSPGLREVVLRLPAFVQPAPTRHPILAVFDAQGTLQRTLQDPEGRRFAAPTSAQQQGERVYIGSLTEPRAAWLER
ncbi:SMP-30/gluconolactonase/LRE family protein [Pseudenhygromyxa sp. WMMC2535]|uniref:SMP-30/gluconolactonase/LRE family protein n=1 Tax=Pseudenhygromyxa sp. WMMC2535 TaxID=2712867 RepID=UPI001557464F|nr:SMP-30/gluconolactonase/LRE family protein [Pseudenhygromyxa sp. WMMC2535]